MLYIYVSNTNMYKLIGLILLILINSSNGYIARFSIITRNDICSSVCSFMDLNDVINRRDKGEYINNLRIKRYNNSSICFTYNTYSQSGYYNYKYKYLIMNVNTYLIKYEIDVDDYIYKYLFYIKANKMINNIHVNRTIWNVIMKTNETHNMNIGIIRLFKRCVNKRINNINPLLGRYFKISYK